MNPTLLQLMNLANDNCSLTGLAAKLGEPDGSHRVAGASFAETYTCPDPTCRPEINLTITARVGGVTIRHDDWCSELARRRAKAHAANRRRKGSGKR